MKKIKTQKKQQNQPLLPNTKFFKKTGTFKVTATGYFKNKNGKILPIKAIKN